MYFGAKLLKDAYEMEGDGPSEELQEVEEELEKKKGDGNEADDDEDLEKQVDKKSKSKLAVIGVESLKVMTQVRICS